MGLRLYVILIVLVVASANATILVFASRLGIVLGKR
jgi:hypothetical protein